MSQFMGTCDIAVVGGGAAGLTAAIFAAEAAGGRASVWVLDGAKTLGAKILVSGGGRCNVTHDVVGPGDFNGPRNVVRNVLAAFDEKRTVKWFYDMGVEMKREATGKLFPLTDSARTVLDALLRRCSTLGVLLQTGRKVTGVTSRDGGFLIRHDAGEVQARRVIISTGGRSLPKTGSDGGGYELVRGLGHTITDTWAALVPLVLEESFFHGRVSGLAVEAEVTTVAGGKRVDRRAGSLLFTHFGVSGPVVMDASRFWVGARLRGEEAGVKVALVPGGFEAVEGRLKELAAARNKAIVVNVVGTMLPVRLAEEVVGYAGIPPATTMSQLSKEGRRKLVHALTALELPVARDRGWNYAEVTAGGVPMGEVDFRTMESRRCPGLYLAGEILDVDGRIGGFNFQWAWATGYLAGRGAAGSLGGEG